MADAALKAFDANGNGSLEAAELGNCPGLKLALPTADKTGDKKLSRDELVARFTLYRSTGVGAVAVSGRAAVDGRPVGLAAVVFTPEACMLGSVPTCTARTAEDGSLSLFQVGDQPASGLPCGLYRVTVNGFSGKGGAPLGCEVVEGGRGGSAPLQLDAVSK
jgi:hypothetical protein